MLILVFLVFLEPKIMCVNDRIIRCLNLLLGSVKRILCLQMQFL